MIFSRGKGGKRESSDKAADRADESAESPAPTRKTSSGTATPAKKAADRTATGRTATGKATTGKATAGRATTGKATAGAPARPTGAGPYDASDAPKSDAQLVDLGSLRLPAVDGVEVRVAADSEGAVQQVMLVDGASALQVGVFAAPRSEGIWDDVREEIRASLAGEGAQVFEVDGEYGTELQARVRSAEGVADIRFVGVDGPRWMVRAVYQGPAATDPAAGARLTEVLHGLVVDRGTDAFPVREALPLRLPREMAEQVVPAADQGQRPSVGTATIRKQQPPKRG